MTPLFAPPALPRRSRSDRRFLAPLALAQAVLLPTGVAAESLRVPNPSFEAPATVFADPAIESWQKAPKPDWYDESGGFPWDQLVGVFLNTPADKPDHIANVDGTQAAFLFAVPGAAIFQDRESTPTHDFDVPFEIGRSYRLTVGVLGGGGGMKDGVTLELSLYYRDASGNPVTVATTVVTNEAGRFADRSRFTDVEVVVPTVRSTDAWAGQSLGIRISSTVLPDLAGGYWDIENVRLTREIVVPNGSFELPATAFADPRVDSWQKAPKPDWYDESGGFPWDQLIGVFLNTAPEATDHITNLEGTQATFLFAVPQAELFQDRDSTPTHDFEARFLTGRAYSLTVGVLGGGGGMKPDVTLDLSLYFRDAAGNRVTVASTTVTHSPEAFPSRNQMVDITVPPLLVAPGSAWADKPIGIALTSTVRPDLAGGYWDLENVRLTETSMALLRNPVWSAGQFSVQLLSAPGSRFEFLSAPSLGLPMGSWTSLGRVTNLTGSVVFADPTPGPGPRFYQARQLP